MAILESRIQTGVSWAKESLAIFKQAPRKWMLLALAYLAIFLIIPSIPGLQIFAFVTILFWPVIIVVLIRYYRNAEYQKVEKLADIMQLIQPKMKKLLRLGFVNLLYSILVSIVLSADLQALEQIMLKQTELTDQEKLAAFETMMPVFLKLALMFIPLMMAVWYAPMLIAFNDYSVMKSLKSSIAGSIQYMLAMVITWLLISVGIVLLMMLATVVAGLFSFMQPVIAQTLMSVFFFGCMLVSIALMLAFQYVSYRDVFRAA
jgi:hypothetical protein